MGPSREKTSDSTKNGTFIFAQPAKCSPPLAMSAPITRSATWRRCLTAVCLRVQVKMLSEYALALGAGTESDRRKERPRLPGVRLIMSLRADRYRQRAAEAKDRETSASRSAPFVQQAHPNRPLRLRVRRGTSKQETYAMKKNNPLGPLTDIAGELLGYTTIIGLKIRNNRRQ
jgi:hypothetical protein